MTGFAYEALAEQRIKFLDQSGAYGHPATRMWKPWDVEAIGPYGRLGARPFPIPD